MNILITSSGTALAGQVTRTLDEWLSRLRSADRVFVDDLLGFSSYLRHLLNAMDIRYELTSKFVGSPHWACDHSDLMLAICSPGDPNWSLVERGVMHNMSIAVVAPEVDSQPAVTTAVDLASGPDWGAVPDTSPKHVVAVDFDGTVVEHRFPEVGADVPGAVAALRQLTEAGTGIILWTMRSGPYLEAAWAWYQERGIPLYGVNGNPTQSEWTTSPKAYADQYIDDAAVGCPLVRPRDGRRPYVDWPEVMATLHHHNAGPVGGHPDELLTPQVELPL